MKPCLQCNKEFPVENYRKDTAKFCSILCHNRNIGMKKIGTHLSNATKKKIGAANAGQKFSKVCISCSNVFVVTFVHLGQKYCSMPCYGKSKEGFTPWNKGIKLSSEHLLKISGKNASNWQGGKTSENQILRHRKEYRLWREAVFARDNWECQDCHTRSQKGTSVVLNADHIKPWSLFPELRFAIDNGRTLCASCHYKTDTFGCKINRLRVQVAS